MGKDLRKKKQTKRKPTQVLSSGVVYAVRIWTCCALSLLSLCHFFEGGREADIRRDLQHVRQVKLWIVRRAQWPNGVTSSFPLHNRVLPFAHFRSVYIMNFKKETTEKRIRDHFVSSSLFLYFSLLCAPSRKKTKFRSERKKRGS